MKLRLLMAAMALVAAPVGAQPMTPAEQAWNALANADVDAALKLIEDNHPGAGKLKAWVTALPR